MDIKQMAIDLGKKISEDDVTKTYKEAMQEYRGSAELQNLIFEYNTQTTALGAEKGSEDKKEDVIAMIQKRSDELLDSITKHPVYIAFTTSQDAMNGLIDMVNREISIAIFGEQPASSCTHDCSSCGSSCGHDNEHEHHHH